jgi:hypothetical protein
MKSLKRRSPADMKAAWESMATMWLQQNLVHRGQWCGAGALRSELPAMAFGTRSAANLYAQEPNNRILAKGREQKGEVFTARLAATKVYCRTALAACDPFFDLDVIGEDFGRDVMMAIAEEWGSSATRTGAYEELHAETGMSLDEMLAAWPQTLPQLPPVDAHLALRVPALLEALQDAGYDAVAIGGSGQTQGQMEWHIFDPSLARDPQTGEPLPVFTEEPQMEITP